MAGSADFKTELNQSDMFDPRLQAVVLAVVDVSYGEWCGGVGAVGWVGWGVECTVCSPRPLHGCLYQFPAGGPCVATHGS